MSTYQRSINQLLSQQALITSISNELNFPLVSSNEITILSENFIRFTSLEILNANNSNVRECRVRGFNLDTVVAKVEGVKNKTNKRYLLKND